MKIVTYGFKTDGIKDEENFFKFLAATPNKIFKHGNFERILNIKEYNDYFLGILITIKDQKAFYLLQKKPGALTVKKEDLASGDSLMEFNFFIFNKKSKRGLYQQYHLSTQLESFGNIIQNKFEDYKENEAKKASIVTDEVDAFKQKYGILNIVPLLTQQAFEEEIASLGTINNFTFYVIKDHEDSLSKRVPSVGVCAQSEKRTIVFKRALTGKVSDLVQQVKLLLKDFNPKKASLKGKTDSGSYRNICLDKNKNKSYFAEEEFDNLIDSIGDFEVTDFHKSQAIKTLIALANEKAKIFTYDKD